MTILSTIELAQITGGVNVGNVASPKVLANPGSSVVGGNVDAFKSGTSAVGNVAASGGPASFAERFGAVDGSAGGGVSGGGGGGGGGGGW